MSCNYCWNQPKKYGKYDMYLDGKLTANEVIYKTVSESGKKENVNLDTKIKEIEERLKVHFTFQTVPELPDVGEETVIYLVSNEKNSGDKDSYNEYMWVKTEENEGKFELIGSGTYAKQTADLYQVTGYTDFDKFDNKKSDGVDINSRINKEIKNRTDEDTLIRETVASITGYSFEKISDENSATNIDNRIKNEIKDREADVAAEKERAIEAENKLSARIETIENYDIDSRVKKLENDLPAEKERAEGEEKRIEEKLDQEIEQRTAQIIGINQVAKENRIRIEQLENYDIDSRVKKLENDLPAETRRAQEAENNLLNKFDDYDATIQSLQEQITQLNDTITQLNDRIAALETESKPEEPENGEATEPTEPETPTE